MPNSGLDTMLDMDKIEDLSRLYRLFIMVHEGLPTLRRAIRNSIVRRGKDINNANVGDGGDQDEEEPEDAKGKGKGKARAQTGSQTLQLALKWVEDVLQLKDKFDSIWAKAFRSDREIESSMNEASISGLDHITGALKVD